MRDDNTSCGGFAGTPPAEPHSTQPTELRLLNPPPSRQRQGAVGGELQGLRAGGEPSTLLVNDMICIQQNPETINPKP